MKYPTVTHEKHSHQVNPHERHLGQVPSRETLSVSGIDEIHEEIDTPRDQDGHLQSLHAGIPIASPERPLHSVFSRKQKLFIVFIASWAGFFSPVSSSIYFPALNALASDLKVTNSLINLTLTSYMIFQGLAPAFVGNLADAVGRRPAYTFCFITYIAANIGLALQDSYAALFVLRCLQSTGSSATIAMASAVVADIATPAERGKYMGFTLAGSLFGPAIGPVIGGILIEFLSWRAIFWFLAIFASIFLVVFGLFFPETARSIVGNGSVPPTGINMSFTNYIAIRRARQIAKANPASAPAVLDDSTRIHRPKARFPNPLSSVRILLDRSNALLLFYNGFMFAVFYDISASIPSQFAAIYGFSDLQIGLCYMPFGAGSLCASLVNGTLLDRNFRRWCKKLDIPIHKGRDQDLSEFPIEKTRLEIALPATYLTIALIIVFGWVLHFRGPVAVLLVVLFLASFSMSIVFNSSSTLLIDFYPKQAGTATAANNLVRCLLGAAATGLIVPMIEGMTVGWTYTFLSLFLAVSSPMLWILMWKGMDWRKVRISKEREKEMQIERENGRIEEGRNSEKHVLTTRKASTGVHPPNTIVSVEPCDSPRLS